MEQCQLDTNEHLKTILSYHRFLQVHKKSPSTNASASTRHKLLKQNKASRQADKAAWAKSEDVPALTRQYFCCGH
jgi:hypothetical protein